MTIVETRAVTGGVDTHADTHVAAALDSIGGLLGMQLEELLAHGTDAADIIAACLRSPLYATRFHEGFGTLYTAEYRPIDGVARYHWPHRTWEHSLDKVLPESIQLRLGIP